MEQKTTLAKWICAFCYCAQVPSLFFSLGEGKELQEFSTTQSYEEHLRNDHQIPEQQSSELAIVLAFIPTFEV